MHVGENLCISISNMVGTLRALGRSRCFKGRIQKRALLLLVLCLVIYITSYGNQSEVSENRTINEARTAHRISPYYWIEHRIEKSLERKRRSEVSWLNIFGYSLFSIPSDATETESSLLLNWEDSSKAERCRYMIDAIYLINSGWTNSLITKYTGQELDDVLISLLGERLRLYNYCFAASDAIPPHEVFERDSILDPENKLGVSSKDYMRRMFPFLKDPQMLDSPLWPKIIDLRTGVERPRPTTPANFNENIWSYWRNYSDGRGIVITLAESSKQLFFKQLKVLDYLANDLDIQIVIKGAEYSSSFIEEISAAVKDTNQQVYLVDCSPILDTEFAENNIKNVINKWLAVIFNTFEEMILLDVDAVPFQDMKIFLEDPKYKSSGILMYKDRNMPNEHTPNHCIPMLIEVEPSYQEKALIGTKLKYSTWQESFEESEEASVFQRFFKSSFLHHVDSGLVVINKSKNLNGLVFSFMLNLNGKIKTCVYGDKEIFWLGQLFAGQDYSIYPVDGGIIGPLSSIVDEDDSSTTYQICSAQMAHTSVNDEILWTNGGLKACKIDNSAEHDFSEHYEYFSDRYNNVENLQRLYDQKLKIDGSIVPNVNKNPWFQLLECGGYIYCASAVKDTNSRESTGHLIEFDDLTANKLETIAQVWNKW